MNTKWRCSQCDKVFSHRPSLIRHQSKHEAKLWKCHICHKAFNRKDNLSRHMKNHSQPLFNCNNQSDAYQQHHMQEGRGTEAAKECSEEALGGSFKVVTIPLAQTYQYDPLMLLKHKYEDIKKKINTATNQSSIKWYLSLQVQFSKPKGEITEQVSPHFRGNCQISLKSSDIEESLQDSIRKIHSSFIEYQRQGSNWTLDKVLKIKIHLVKYKPLKGSSYIPTPIKLRSKHAIVNVQNRDRKCFMWSMLAALHPTERNTERIGKYVEYANELTFEDITFPVKRKDIHRFEIQNKISVNVLGFEKGNLYPVHVTKERFDRHVDLLLLSDGKKSHYCWIKSMSRLLGHQNSHGHRYHYCIYCLQGFTSHRVLEKHQTYCKDHNAQRVELPKEEDKWLYYKDVRKQLKVPFIIYADFESFQIPISGCENDPASSFAEKSTHHVPSSFAYKVVGLNHELSKKPVVYRGPGVAEKFVDCMLQEMEEIEEKFKHVEPMIMTKEDWRSFHKASRCHICGKDLGADKVRDHDHMTGRFRGAAHNECNLNYKFTGKIPVVFHNLRGYDSHLIMSAIGKTNKKINCIANNMEKYISFSLGCMDFIDSFQFMSASLEKLICNLSKEGQDKFPHMSTHFDNDYIGLLLRKQVYPYDYFDEPERFSETSLPPKEAFVSSLTGEAISNSDYHHAQQVWESFNIKTLGEYSDLYVLSDTLTLADVFENFRNLCLDAYGLDAAHFYTAPGLAWQAALRCTGVQLELLTDIDQHLFIENGLRGGISMISHRHVQANNPYVSGYDPSKDKSYIMYLDANNLYGWAMSQPLPTHEFDWLTEKEIKSIDFTKVKDDADEGYILEVNLEYPEEIHDQHADYPLAPEHIQVTPDMLSPYAKSIAEDLKLKGSFTTKLVPNLNDKNRYVVHYRNLKQYLSLGMKLSKIHRVLSFKQSPWLKSYIDFNTDKRKQARNDFEKDFYKLMNNSVFGKTMENLRKRVKIELVNNQKRAMKLSVKPSFQGFRIFNEDLVGVNMKIEKLYLNRPIYVGFSILDMSKTLMYDFHYNHIKKIYGLSATLLFTDTDSLAYVIQTNDIYEDMMHSLDLYDTSEYPNHSQLFSLKNKKIIGKMKDETYGNPIHAFVGLKSKMYAYTFEQNGKEIQAKRAKGVKKSVVQNQIKYEQYLECIEERKVLICNMKQIRSYDHQLYNISINKLGLSPYDDKRYILNDGISTLPYGHWRIKNL